MKSLSRFEVPVDRLRWRCDPNSLGFETTDDFSCRPHIIGQDRALDAIRLGLDIRQRGYNIFVSGLTGTGKSTAIKRVLETMDLGRPDLEDIGYVYNFRDVDRPVCIQIPAGRGCDLRASVADLRTTVEQLIPEVLRSQPYRHRQSKILASVKTRRERVTTAFEKEVIEHGFSLVEMDQGGYTRPGVAPVVAGEVVDMEDLPRLLVQGKMGKGDFQKMQAAYPRLMDRLDEVLADARELQREMDERQHTLEREYIGPLIRRRFNIVRRKFDFPRVGEFLDGLEGYVLDNIPAFGRDAGEKASATSLTLPFEVNVIVDNSDAVGAPVVIEHSPGFVNLFGVAERKAGAGGDALTDFTAIRGGSLHRAHRGYLVIGLTELMEDPHAYSTLKRALKNRSHQIRGFDSLMVGPISAIKPEPVQLDVKVILIGDAYSYQALYEWDDDFRKIFRVKAEFDSVMPRRRSNVRRYSRFIKSLCTSESLLPFHKSGVAAIVEEGVRRAGRRTRLSTRFSDIGDLARESDYWARHDGARSVRKKHVLRARSQRIRRNGLYEEKIQEMYDDGTILIDTNGTRAGQLNGLAVFDLGDHLFGRPSRITAETGVGRAGVVNVEREADMSGRIHNKGVLILEGYLRRQYAQDKPITMTASVCFEQAYSGIDGDSASSTEIYALLSSISGIPLRQDIAVTGSVNQKGEVQPIGGVNEKIEGFFDVCCARGLTGKQGVMIPALNRNDLMLREDVVAAVKSGKFHVYAVRTIDEGITILAGQKAGHRLKSGHFSRGSVHERVDEALRTLHEHLREAEDGDERARRSGG